MATSGTYDLTRFTTRKVIDNAYGAVKITRPAITAERIEVAYDWLYMTLQAMENKGIPLFAVQRTLLPIYYNEITVTCPTGTKDVLNLNLRRMNRLATGTASSSAGDADDAFDGDFDTSCNAGANGYIQLEFEEGETLVPMYGILPAVTAEWNYTLQGSEDGITWVTFYTATAEEMTALEWKWFDIQGMQPWAFIRLQATGGTVLNVAELVFSNNPNEINMALINRDDYANLPNKYSFGQPTQYWLQQDRDVPLIQLWSNPNEQCRFWNLSAYLLYRIQDIGTMIQEIQVRRSDYLALVLKLATYLKIVDPEAKPDPDLVPTAEAAWKDMWDGESDKAPTTLLPNIRPYTR